MNSVRFGLIGVGNMGKAHALWIQGGEVARAELVAVCDIDRAQMQPYAHLRQYREPNRLIRSGEVDAVIIATPHYAHTSLGIAALQQGLHVLVEKPISVHKADCERLIAAHTKKRQVFGAMFQMRTYPVYQKIKKLISDGELGAIQRINWIITDWFRAEAYYTSGGWRATWRGEGGGVLLNQCPHNLDLMYWFFGMPTRVTAHCGFGKYHDIEVEDEVTAYLEYANGATGVFIATTGEAPGTNRLEIAGDRGKLVYENNALTFTRNETGKQQWSKTAKEGFVAPPVWHCEIPVPNARMGHQVITENFCAAILNKAELLAPASEGIHSVELANAMILSGLTKKPVDLPLHGAAYERRLKKLIAESRFKKKRIVKQQNVDMGKSFK